MADISIIEFIVYGLIAYSGMLMLIFSAFGKVDAGIKGTGARIIWLVPCLICAAFLSQAGENITFDTIRTVNTITDNNTSAVIFTEDVSTQDKIVLVQPVWATVHILMFFVMLVYVILEIVRLFTRHD